MAYTHHRDRFFNKRQVEIFYQSWTVFQPRARLVLSHGLGEHSGRYQHLLAALQDQHISVFALDHQGHGRSGGRRGHIDCFAHYSQDLKQFIDTVAAPSGDNPAAPLILLGHSLGGLIATHYALTYPTDLAGLILSSPALIPARPPAKIELTLTRLAARWLGRWSMSNRLKAEDLSSDPEAVAAYLQDPLVHDRITLQWIREFFDTAAVCQDRLGELERPLLLIHGDQDRISDVQASRIIYETARSADKTLCILEGLYHETMNEPPPERQRVLTAISDWILARV